MNADFTMNNSTMNSNTATGSNTMPDLMRPLRADTPITVRKMFNPDMTDTTSTSRDCGYGAVGGDGINGAVSGADRSGSRRKLRVAAYCRVSTETDEQITSFDTQVRSYTELIKSNPEWEFAGVYADDGITGTSATMRPEFMRMIEDCKDPKNRKIDLILTKSISRFARNTVECIDYIRKLSDNGVNIIFESNNIDTRSTYSEMLVTILAAFAQEESRSISENTKWGIRKRFEQGEARWTRIYGYEKGYVINPKEAAVVQKIFSLYEHGMSTKSICKWLKEHDVKNPSGGKTWSQTQICNLLSNERYIGDLLMQKFYTEDHITHRKVKNDFTEIPSYYAENHHTPIVSHKQFQRVQAIRSMRIRQRTRADETMGYNEQYPLGEKLVCPYCGSILYQRNLEVQKEKGSGWCCERGGNPCEQFIIRSKFVNEAILRGYRELNLKLVRTKLDNPKLKRAAEVMLGMKEKNPVFEKVDYWWVDELIDHIEFGQHSKTQRELMRERAIMERKYRTQNNRTKTLDSDTVSNNTVSKTPNNNTASSICGGAVNGSVDTGAGMECIDDRTMRIFWRCGIISTVPSGVCKDKDDPKFVAKLFKKVQEARQKREEQRKREMEAAKRRAAEQNAKQELKQVFSTITSSRRAMAV